MTLVAISQRARRLLLASASLALSWSAAVAVTGGLLVHTPWGPLSSTNPGRPFAVGAAAMLVYLLWCRRHWMADLAPLFRLRWPVLICGIALAAAFLLGIWGSSFFGAGPDASGYVSQAAMWLRGVLTWPAPEWVKAAPWPDATAASAPVGYRPGAAMGIIVPTFPPGLPLLMAAFQSIGGPNGAYYVAPACGALAVWATYRIGSRFAGSAAGAVASVLLLSSPAFLIMLVQPMSDVPAAALWACAMVAAFGTGTRHAVTAGLVSGAAILVRPNLAPLALPTAALIAAHSSPARDRIIRVLTFSAAAAPAVVALAALNAKLHGGPLRSGYGAVGSLFDVARVLPNLAAYGTALVETQTPVVLFAFALPVVLTKYEPRRAAIIAAIAHPLMVLALYLPYENMKVWWFLRFLLPAYPAMLGGAAAAMVAIASRYGRGRSGTWILGLLVSAVAVHGFMRAHDEGVFGIREADRRYIMAASYAQTLPERSVLISRLHSGTLHYYTGRDVLRWDAISPLHLDRAVEYLISRGYSVHLVMDPAEADAFRQRFAGARLLPYLEPEFAEHLPGGVLVYPLEPR